MLAGQVGIGSPTTGSDYTLMSITVVVLGGASVTGGRGSFVATLLGAALVRRPLVLPPSSTPIRRCITPSSAH